MVEFFRTGNMVRPDESMVLERVVVERSYIGGWW
jgi:hypothetical protein